MLGAIRRRSPESGVTRNTSVQPIDNGCAFSGNESLDHRVYELEKSREVLVKELQVGRRIQRDMQKEIEALKTQMNGVLSVLLRQISQTQGPPSDSIFRNVAPMLLKSGQSDRSVHTTPDGRCSLGRLFNCFVAHLRVVCRVSERGRRLPQ